MIFRSPVLRAHHQSDCINITLAVSLNLINGSQGSSRWPRRVHASAWYTATYLTVYHGRQSRGAGRQYHTDPLGGSLVMIPSSWLGRRRRARDCRPAYRPSAERRLSRDCHARVQREHRVIILNIRCRRGNRVHRPINHEFLLDLLVAVLTIAPSHGTSPCLPSGGRCLRYAATRLQRRRWGSTRQETR